MKLKGKNAISLIVLVITILVLSILAATVIISLSNTNIISQANDAVKKTEVQQIEEAKTLMYADGMLGNSPEDMVIGDYTLSWDDTTKKIITSVDTVRIPESFHYVEGKKDTGLVIEDKDGNQFVWVPVEDYSTFKRGTAELNSDGIYKMTGVLGTEMSVYSEYENEEYTSMSLSVKNNKGFYIARFEAGKQNDVVVSKKDVEVYKVTRVNNAEEQSKAMYKDSTDVVSTLCYGVQWDATMNFVSDASHDITSSSSWGNYSDSTGLAAVDSGVAQTTGKNEMWKAKNIYDLAGNAGKYTMEWCTVPGSVACPVIRGAYDNFNYVNVGACLRYFGYFGELSSPLDENEFIGFRVTLYLK